MAWLIFISGDMPATSLPETRGDCRKKIDSTLRRKRRGRSDPWLPPTMGENTPAEDSRVKKDCMECPIQIVLACFCNSVKREILKEDEELVDLPFFK